MRQIFIKKLLKEHAPAGADCFAAITLRENYSRGEIACTGNAGFGGFVVFGLKGGGGRIFCSYI
jgi:hypothetical protein